MTRAALTISPRRPALPAFKLFDKELIFQAAAASRAKLTAGIWHNGVLWACSNFGLYKSTDGGYNFSLVENLNSKYSTVGVEGIFISSSNYIYINDSRTGSILWNQIDPDTNLLVNANFVYCKCSDGATDFIFPADPGAGTAGHFNNWSMWEIEHAYELGDETALLAIGDIVMGHYHRTSSGKHQRRAFIYVLRANIVNAKDDPTVAAVAHVPDPALDPFPQWNSVQAYVRRHIHNVVIGLDGYLYFTSGDNLISYAITSVSGTTPVVITCAEHGLVTGNIVGVAGNSVEAVNTEWVVTKIDIDTFSLNGSVGATHGSGTGGTFAPRVKSGDTLGTYRFQRLKIGSDSWEEVKGSDHGYTVLFRRPDGKILGGNDMRTAAMYVGGTMVIDLFDGATLEKTCYTPIARYDSPIWEIVREIDTDTYFAALQSPGGSAAGVGIPGLLRSDTGGESFVPMLFSGSTDNDANRVNVDRIYCDRHRELPSASKNMIIQVAPETGRGEYYIYDLTDTVENKLKCLGNMKRWFKADSITGLANGAVVASWTDSSPAAESATQATANVQPTYKTNALNGYPAVTFDGDATNPDFLSFTALALTTYTVFVVYKCTSTATNPYSCLVGAVKGGLYAGGTNANAPGFGAYDGAGWFMSTSKLTTAALGCLSNRALFVNGSIPTYATQKILAELTLDTIGKRTVSVTTGYGGDIYEIIVYAQELPQQKRLYVQNYLASKYGLTIGTSTV
jgi:hypothetical protein